MARNKVPTQQFEINTFDPREMKKGALVLIMAKKGMGKSYLTLDLMHQLRKRFSGGIVITKTAGTDKNGYGSHIPPLFIHEVFNDAELLQMFEERRKLVENLRDIKRKHPEKIKYDIEREWFMIFDDCMDDIKNKNSKIFSTIGLRGRHANLFTIVIYNSPTQILPAFCNSADYIMLFQPNNAKVTDALYETYAPTGLDKHEWRYLISNITNDYGVLVINRPAGSKDPLKSLQFYKAGSEHETAVELDDSGQPILDRDGVPVPWQLGSKNSQTFSAQYSKKEKLDGNCIGLLNMRKRKPAQEDDAPPAEISQPESVQYADANKLIKIMTPKADVAVTTASGGNKRPAASYEQTIKRRKDEESKLDEEVAKLTEKPSKKRPRVHEPETPPSYKPSPLQKVQVAPTLDVIKEDAEEVEEGEAEDGGEEEEVEDGSGEEEEGEEAESGGEEEEGESGEQVEEGEADGEVEGETEEEEEDAETEETQETEEAGETTPSPSPPPAISTKQTKKQTKKQPNKQTGKRPSKTPFLVF